MEGVSFNTNIPALGAQRRLQNSTSSLQSAFEHLSSGLRISRASDDAAGLAISSGLQLDSRVYTQGVRNVNDSIGALNIQEGALTELVSLTTRQRELATQSANGVLSTAQRRALDQECQTLNNEYNRILSTTSFNGMALLDSSFSLSVQAGYSSVNISAGSTSQAATSSTTGDGTFGSHYTYSTGMGAFAITSGDVTGDGKTDLIVSTYYEYFGDYYSAVGTFTGIGNGQFNSPPSYSMSLDQPNVSAIATADLNHDSKLDIVMSSSGNTLTVGLTGVSVHAYSTPGTGDSNNAIGDYNNDGNPDIIAACTNTTYLFLGNADGSFKAATTVGLSATKVKAVDINNDGNLDFVAASASSSQVYLYLGQGNGTFQAVKSFSMDATPSFISCGDFNGDHKTDILAMVAGTWHSSVLLGNGDGTFKARVDSASGYVIEAEAADFNGDGLADYVGGIGTSNQVFLGNGDGYFKAGTVYAGGGTGNYNGGTVIGDFNGDGALDFASAKAKGNNVLGGFVDVYLGNTKTTSSSSGSEATIEASFDLTTAANARAAMPILTDRFNSLVRNLGNVGASISRLTTTTSSMMQSRESFDSAASRITDIDVASETALLARSEILQQAGAAVLAQANQAPQLMLSLLRGAA